MANARQALRGGILRLLSKFRVIVFFLLFVGCICWLPYRFYMNPEGTTEYVAESFNFDDEWVESLVEESNDVLIYSCTSAVVPCTRVYGHKPVVLVDGLRVTLRDSRQEGVWVIPLPDSYSTVSIKVTRWKDCIHYVEQSKGGWTNLTEVDGETGVWETDKLNSLKVQIRYAPGVDQTDGSVCPALGPDTTEPIQ